jgi:hypothetical protein
MLKNMLAIPTSGSVDEVRVRPDEKRFKAGVLENKGQQRHALAPKSNTQLKGVHF